MDKKDIPELRREALLSMEAQGANNDLAAKRPSLRRGEEGLIEQQTRPCMGRAEIITIVKACPYRLPTTREPIFGDNPDRSFGTGE
jgi:hypothetical protein